MTPKQKFCWLLGAVVLLGLLLRLGVGWQLATFNDGRNSVFTPSAQTDLKTYMTLAAEIAKNFITSRFIMRFFSPVYTGCSTVPSGRSSWLRPYWERQPSGWPA